MTSTSLKMDNYCIESIQWAETGRLSNTAIEVEMKLIKHFIYYQDPYH